MIACTHTHSGPATVFLRDCGEVDRPYLDQLRLGLVDAARTAAANLREARLGIGRGHLDKGVINRRQPGAPIDPDVSVIGFQAEAGQVLAILVNYTCHPVCLDHTNRLISADYPGVLARVLHEQTGAVVLFTNGAAGDINPQQMGDFSYAEDLGRALAAETLRILAPMEFRDTADLHVTSEMLNLPFKSSPATTELDRMIAVYRQRCQEAEAAGDGLNAKLHRAMLGWAEDTLAGALRADLPKDVPLEIQVISLGEAVLAGISGEIFSELGKQIKDNTLTRRVLVLGYANNDIGYIPTRQAYALGGYEIDDAFKFYGYPAVLAPEAGSLLLQAAIRLLDSE